MVGPGSDIESRALDNLRHYIGKGPEQIESMIKEHLNHSSKSYFRTLADRMLRSSPDVYLELVNNNVSIRAVRIQKNGIPKESMSLPVFKFDEIIEQEWINSDLRKQLGARFFFLIFKVNDDGEDMTFFNAAFWSMPEDDIERIAFVWEDTKIKVIDGKFDSFIPKAANLIAHVRPHAQSSSDTYVYDGKECKKYSFWLNNDYIGGIISVLPRLSGTDVQDEWEPISLEDAILKELRGREGPMIPFKLKRAIDQKWLESEDYDSTINSMIQKGLLERTTDGLRSKRYKLKDMLKTAPMIVSDYFSMDKKQFFSEYAEEETTFLTLQAFFSVRPEEDCFCTDFSRYRFGQRQFQELYGVDDATYRYLELMHPKGWMSPDELLDDPNKSDTFKRKLRSILYNTVEIGEIKIDVNDESIITYVVSKYNKPKTINEISRQCKDFVSNNGLKNASLCRMNGGDIREYADREGTRILRLDSSHVKYYPHDEKEVIQFLNDLQLNRYMNMYVATQLLINDSGDLCRKMDINDEQELYMLMSKYKSSAPMKESAAILSSPPSICFGEATISNQIENLLKETGRIKKADFGKLYSERYGMKEQSIRSHMTKYPQYSNGDYYDMNLPVFPDDVIDYLSTQFTAPIISTDVVIRRFQNAESKFNLEISKDDMKKHNDPYFNADNLRKLGYRSGQGSIFIEKYQNLKECIETEYLQSDFIRLDDDLKNNTSFMRIFEEYVEMKKYYLMSEDQYISSKKLASVNITQDTIDDYVNQALECVGNQSYFTLKYLRNIGFEHYLEDKGFDDEFYENILSTSLLLKNSDICKHKVFTGSVKFSRNDAVVNMALKALGNDDCDYVDLLSERIELMYGMDLLSELKREHKPLKYCKYTEKVYRDDETYINEIRGIQ